MSKFIITGGKQLKGEIKVAGSKNAMFPLIAATLLTDQECTLNNLPLIKDLVTMVDILKDLGVSVGQNGRTLTIKAQTINKTELDPQAGKIRGSIVLLGALLARCKQASMAFPGGDRIGKRPIDAHLRAFECLGANTSSDQFISIEAGRLVGCKIVLEESSVTATENVILAAVLAEGKTIIKLAAMEPHVQQLCRFLNLMGAKISGIGTTNLEIEGVASLQGAAIDLLPDSNEAASFMVLAAATKSDIKVSGLDPDYLEDDLLQLRKMNVNYKAGRDFIHVLPPPQAYKAAKIQCGLYPKLPSDDVPTFAVLATQAVGESLLYEWLYEDRLGYIDQLKQMGANAQVLDVHRVKILGPTPLRGQKLNSYDIRMGMTLVIAALVAEGESEISDIHHIDRGYENLEQRLQSLGADIRRVD